MLTTTKLNNCPGCKDLHVLVDDLDCYIAERGLILLNNIRFSLTKKINKLNLHRAIKYKQILIARSFNPNYAGSDIADIINKVKSIIYGL